MLRARHQFCTNKSLEDVVVVTIPTIGFTVETVKIKPYEFNAWDAGGCAKNVSTVVTIWYGRYDFCGRLQGS
jgi:hypothetical protein